MSSSESHNPFFQYHEALEQTAAAESFEVVAELVKTSATTLAEQQSSNAGIDVAYATNSEFQQRSRILPSESNQNNWGAAVKLRRAFEKEVLEFVAKNVGLCSRTRLAVENARQISPFSYLVNSRFFLHMWRCRRDAKAFVKIYRQLAQANLEHMTLVIFVPLTVLVQHQGVYLTATLLPPIVNARPIHVGSNSIMHVVLDSLKKAAGVGVSLPLPLHLGADERLYLLDISGALRSGCVNVHTSFSCLVRPESIDATLRNEDPEESRSPTPTPPVTPKNKRRCPPPPASADRISLFLPQLTGVVPKLEADSVSKHLRSKMLSDLLHSSGLNVRCLGQLAGTLLKTRDDPPKSVMALLYHEMISRALRALLEAAAELIDVPPYAPPNLAMELKTEAIAEVAGKFMTDPKYFDQIVRPIVQFKFEGLPTITHKDVTLRDALNAALKRIAATPAEANDPEVGFDYDNPKSILDSLADMPRVVSHQFTFQQKAIAQCLESHWEGCATFRTLPITLHFVEIFLYSGSRWANLVQARHAEVGKAVEQPLWKDVAALM